MSQIITYPSQLFRRNEPTEPTHVCYLFRLTTNRGQYIPKFKCVVTSGVYFRVRSYASNVYTCELYLPFKGSPEISDPFDLAFCVAAEFVRQMSTLYNVELLGTEDYSRYHSYDTHESDCYNYIP